MKSQIHSFIIIFVLIASALFAQISPNLLLKKNILDFNVKIEDSFKYNLHDHLYTFLKDSVVLGIDINGGFRTKAVDQYENYNDDLTYQFSPFLHYEGLSNFSMDVRVNIENIQDDYVYSLRPYWADTFAKHRGAYDIAKLTYNSKSFQFKFGRDYYMPGIYLYENLLFSKYNYSYDQIGFEYHNKYFTISSYYLNPNTITDSLTYERHINTHRITVNLGNGYLAFNDVMIYGGYNRYPDVMALNPLILLYPYRKNKKHLDGNNMMSLEFYYHFNDYFIFTELLLDDWQADKEVPSDLEPTEWGSNTTFGINNLFTNINWKINYTHVANRTFNAPEYNYEKYIHKNYPIGHFLGNNFWEAKTSLTYKPDNKLLLDLTFYHYEYGDEALYSEFNTDFLDYTVEEGYEEDFPFGKIKTQTGLVIDSYYNFNENFLANAKMSYWLTNSILKNDVNFSLSIAYRFSKTF